MKKIANIIFAGMIILSSSVAYAGSKWSSDAIDNVKSQKIIIGYPDGNLGLDKFATREELAVAVDRAIRIDKNNYIVINDNNDWNLVVGFSTLFLILGLGAGYLIAKKNVTNQSIEVKMPKMEIPMVQMPYVNNVSNVSTTAGVKIDDDFFKEKKYVPSVESFGEKVQTDKIADGIKDADVRRVQNADDFDKKAEELKKFSKGENK